MASSLPSQQNGVSPAAQANDILRQDAKKGNSTVYTFDPDATPEQKASAAGKGRDQLKSKVDTNSESLASREVAVAGADNVTPTITIQDMDKEAKEQARENGHTTVSPTQPPGAMPAGAAPPIPDWYKVGWRANIGIDAAPEDEDAKEKRMFESWISEQYYGQWYHNAAVIIVAVFASHFLTRFGFGWGWLFILLAFCSTYYTTSMVRVRRQARDDIQRELIKTRLGGEDETTEWLNHFLERFWLIYEPVLSATIISSVDQILSTNCPPFLDSLRLTTFTLGNKAPRVNGVKTFTKTAEDVVQMDWKFSFTPNDASDLTDRQKAMKSNPKVVLTIRVGKGFAAAGMPVLVEDMTFSGLMRIRMKLMTNFPHVQVVDISFLEKPVIDYVLKPIGGETFGFDIANIPGLSSFIRDTTHSILGPMMYDPNVFTLNLEQILSGAPLDTAIGVIKITMNSARSIKGNKIGGGTPDPFVSFSINNRTELARTKYKHNTYNPTWNETKFLLVTNLADSLHLTVFDYNDHRKNTELGSVVFELGQLADDATRDNLALPILKDGKERGELRFDVHYFPVLTPQVNESGVEELPESKVGIVRFVMHQAKDLDTSKVHTADLNPFGKVYVGSQTSSIHTTPKARHTLQPVWESATEFLCTDRSAAVITAKVIDDRDFLKDPCVGYVSVRLEDLLDSKKEAGRDWWPLSGCKSGRVRLSVEWKPLNMAGSLHGADQYRSPIGVVRLWLKKATDVKNVEAALGGKSDPYVRVLVNGTIQARTEVINNNLNPVWDQIIYTPVHSVRETMLLEVMDYQHLTKDRSLGTVELKVSDLATEVPKGSDDAVPQYLYSSTGKKSVADPIRLDRGNSYKGQLHYVAEFVPALNLKGVKFATGPNEIEKTLKDGGIDIEDEDDGDVVKDGSGSLSSGEEADGIVPGRVTVSNPLGHRKNLESTDTTHTAKTVDTVKATETSKTAATNKSKATTANGSTSAEPEETGIELSKDELFSHQSGIIVFNVKSGGLNKKARLEVLLDDGYWPAFSTARATGHKAEWEHVGEGFLKELDFGRVWLRFNVADEGEKDEIVAEWKGDAKPFLLQTLDGVSTFHLTDQDDDRVVGSVSIEARYVPCPVTLEPRESINNMGILRVSLHSGNDIRAVDRGGKSDPFAVFSLNGQKVFKSQTKKKTLNPDWNEDFVVSVPSRVGADFEIEIFDWNQLEQAKSLGSGKINLEDIEPFHGIERTVTLHSPKHGEKGEIKLSLLFQPEIIAKSRKNTSTFSTAGRAMTQIGSLPIGAGKGVFHGVTGVFKHKDKNGATIVEDDEGGAVHHAQNGSLNGTTTDEIPNIPGAQASQPVGQSEHMVGAGGGAPMSFPSSSQINHTEGGKSEPGLLKVTVLDAKDMGSDVKPYATIRLGDKEFKTKHIKSPTPDWNESFTFAASTMTPKLFVWIHDHKTLGKDKQLGQAEIDIWRHVQPQVTSAADVFTELREGQGLLRVRLEFDPEAAPVGRPSMSSGERNPLGSPSRFSLRGKRPTNVSAGSDNE